MTTIRDTNWTSIKSELKCDEWLDWDIENLVTCQNCYLVYPYWRNKCPHCFKQEKEIEK